MVIKAKQKARPPKAAGPKSVMAKPKCAIPPLILPWRPAGEVSRSLVGNKKGVAKKLLRSSCVEENLEFLQIPPTLGA